MKYEFEFYIGPGSEVEHNTIITWLKENNYEIRDISYNGDHYSEITAYGDYMKAYNNTLELGHCSIEHFEN